jgi:hypothetical protein
MPQQPARAGRTRRGRRRSCPPWDRLRAFLNTGRAYSVLDRTAARGGMWTAGGCAILAEAIHALLPSSRVLDLYDHRGGPQHVVVETPTGDLIDGDGVSIRRTLLRRWVRMEGLRPPLRFRPHDPARCHASGIPCAPEDIARIRRFLARAIRADLLQG